jgi:hypothetical protein
MAYRILDCDQRSDDWRQARAGRFTASNAADMLSSVKSGEAAKRRDLRAKIVVERLTGLPQDDGYTNVWMQRGIELEPQARAAYESLTGIIAQPCGFVLDDEKPIGCSPDGVIDDFKGGLELKCPKVATHIGYLRAGDVPAEYVPQLLHSFWVTGATFWDFVSFAPELPEGLRVFYVRVQRNDAQVNDYIAKATAFLEECDREVEALLTMSNIKARLHAAVGAV